MLRIGRTLAIVEPFTTIGVVARVVIAGGVWWVRRPSTKRAHRLAIKRDIEAHIYEPRHDPALEVIVRNEWRMDDYPDKFGSTLSPAPSAWHKAEVLGMYEAGLEVCAGFPRVKISGGVARNDPDGEQVMIVGRIPFDRIGEVDWTGDRYYPMPHVYCRCGLLHGPYERRIRVSRRTSWSGERYIDAGPGVRYKHPRYSLRERLRARRVMKRLDRQARGGD